MNVFYKEENSIAVITFDQPDSKVNVLNTPTLLEFERIIDQLFSPSAIVAVIIQSAKRDIFIAGADIKEIEGIVDPVDGKAKSQSGQRILNKLEDLPVPTFAVIDGAALGGGCELALACRYRVATFSDKVRIGVPEVNLGFVPGFGGTYRLPRLLGLQGALKLILSGNPVDSRAAMKMGLVDRLFSRNGLEARVREFVGEVVASKKRRKYPTVPLKGINVILEKTAIGRSVIFSKSRESVLKASKGFYPAPLKALEVVRGTIGFSRRAALDIESTAFAGLAVTPVSKNLVKLYYLTEKFKKLSIPGAPASMPVMKAGVIGAGIMGGGIAQLLSNRGVWVRLKDINHDAIAKGLKAAYDVYKDALKRKRMKPGEAAARMAMISGTLDHSGFAQADIVIEAVVENMDVKKKVFAELDRHIAARTIIASNTSSLSVAEMSKAVSDPSRVIGFHFFNPVHRMPLLEIITSPQTSQATLASALDFAKRLGKTPVIVKDAPGFLVNRILLAYINEAGRVLEEGGDIARLDRLLTDFGMPMGPFTLADEVGLDVGVKVLHILEAGLGARFKACRIFDLVYERKLLGKKSGKGFYIHGRRRKVNAVVQALVKGGAGATDREALNRMLYIMINEAARLLEEGVVDGADTVDIGMIMGTGFPPFRGGLLRYADALGLENVVSDLQALEGRFQDGRFKPAPYLVALAQQHKSFYPA